MTNFLKTYDLEIPVGNIEYYNDKEPLKLNENFCFYHNKSKFRKDLNKLQYLFSEYMKTPLVAAGIRDSYLEESLSEDYLIVLFTTGEVVKNASNIIKKAVTTDIEPDHFLLVNYEEYMLLLAKNLNPLRKGIEMMHIILKQTLEQYIQLKKFDEFIKISQFKIYSP